MQTFEKKNSKRIPGLFFTEVNGLKEIESGFGKYHSLKTPEIFQVSDEKIVMSKVLTELPKKEFWQNLGRELAKMHLSMANVQYGFEEDNFIGNNPQSNSWESDWCVFFMRNRLLFQINLIKSKFHRGVLSKIFLEKSKQIEEVLYSTKITPTLLHGDLWSGNVLCGENQTPYLIDPAVYYGHSEVDLAMTNLFGGFDSEFYISYQEILPINSGHHERFKVYNLYHVINHFNLFGGSYFNHAMKILESI
ncbi:MAG: fructosamine kinase family protein [Halobacteriovoraceae bacterium]|nr:fructosamine kinase family protein [Halobacteriovoraceae bacterium]